ncbi:MAG: HAMP domain-containing sensor histidine kinase [Pseudomonadota bacterium]
MPHSAGARATKSPPPATRKAATWPPRLLAAAISLPLHRLSAASERVRANLNSRESLPDYTHRADEIGKLSGTLREMTDALYRRLEASERFAADVAHELKNPLTSVRSAAELLPIVKTDAHRHELSETIQHDVKRLTRLIDDISNATRIDAEMGRSSTTPVNLGDVLSTIRDMFNDTWRERDRSVTLSIEPSAPCIVHGHETRLAQVATNLVDNALSFSPEGEAVKIRLSQQGAVYRIEVCDAGPGIPEESLENIFHRFYTDRPGGAESFGNNSGLGLSIARDIVEAHNGRLWAENQYEAASASGGGDTERSEEKSVLGARFVVELPVAEAARRGGSRRG